MRVIQRLLLAAGMMVLPMTSAQANVIVNGGFEAPDIPAGTFQVFAAIPGWTLVAGHSIEMQDHVAGSPFEGNQFVELDSFANSSMQQLAPTTALQPYTLSFAYSPRPGVAAASNGIDVFFNGGLVTALATSGIGLQDTAWTVYSFTVVPTLGTSSVVFTATGVSDQLGGYIDDVRLTQAPEPVTLSLLAIGLCGVAARRFRS
jgi:hypothetical protein